MRQYNPGNNSVRAPKNLANSLEHVRKLLDQGNLSKAGLECESLCQRYGQKYYEPWVVLATIHRRCGRKQQALSCLQMAMKADPKCAEPHTQSAILHHEAGDLAAARASCTKSLYIDADQPSVHFNLGVIYLQESNFLQAEKCFRRVVTLDSGYAVAYANLAYALRMQGKLEAALVQYNHALMLLPDNPEILFNLSVTLEQSGEFCEAEYSYRRVLKFDPHHAEACNGLGSVLIAQGRHKQAVETIRKAISLAPGRAKFYSKLGIALTFQGAPEEGIIAHERALNLDPQFAEGHFFFAWTLLLVGDFKRGWDEYEWRWEAKGFKPRTFSRPLWNGSLATGKTVFLYAEQGVGDTIQFLRYAQLMKEKGARVILECQPGLIRLFSGCTYVDELVSQGGSLPKFDFQAPLLSLPQIFRTDHDSIPVKVPYVSAPVDPTPLLDEALPEKSEYFRIGIVWSGNTAFVHNQLRACPSSCFASLKQLPQVELYSLQKGTPSSELKLLQDLCVVTDLAPALRDFADTATAISRLDLVITVDTSVAHLAGAMGRPVWILLCTAADWRWLLHRDDNPWYPSARLFRQQQACDWSTVFKQMMEALTDLLKKNQSG